MDETSNSWLDKILNTGLQIGQSYLTPKPSTPAPSGTAQKMSTTTIVLIVAGIIGGLLLVVALVRR